MAPRRVHLGRLAAVAAIVAVVVTGCGGGSPSAPGAASDTATSISATPPAAEQPEAAAASSPSGAKAENVNPNPAARSETKSADVQGHESRPDAHLKHKPIELPEGSPEQGPTTEEQKRVPAANIELRLPNSLGRENTCHGKDASPELDWGTAPAGAAELIIFAAGVQPVNGRLHFEWAMAGLDPNLEGLEEGEVPEGAILGRNGDGQNKYSLCPVGGRAETYIFSVYPVSKSLSPKQGFNPLALRGRATDLSESVGVVATSYGSG